MASRDALLSLGMAGLADVLDSSSDEEEPSPMVKPPPKGEDVKRNSGTLKSPGAAVRAAASPGNPAGQPELKHSIPSPKDASPVQAGISNITHVDNEPTVGSSALASTASRRRPPTKLPLFDSDSDADESAPPVTKFPSRKMPVQPQQHQSMKVEMGLSNPVGELGAVRDTATDIPTEVGGPAVTANSSHVTSSRPATTLKVETKTPETAPPTATAKVAVQPSVPSSPPPATNVPSRAVQPVPLSTLPDKVVGFSKVSTAVAADAVLPAASTMLEQPVEPQQPGATLSKLRSISTPAQQLKQKDEQISALQFTVEELQQQLASAEQVKADCVSAAVESAKASLEQDLRSRTSELSTAHAELDACRASVELRERQHQKQLKEAQLSASLAADAASTQLTQMRDQCARDVQDAEARARARVDAANSAQRAQLDSEAAALREERAAMNRERQSTEALSSLSAQVEAVSNTAIQREKRLTARLEEELMDREQRCQQRETALVQREAAMSAMMQDTELMRKQLCEISKKADAAFSECASGTLGDRERLQREAANLNAAVHALQQVRDDAAASMEVQRSVLQDTRQTRDRERERFLRDVSEERVRLAQERTAAWTEVDKAHAAVIESQQKISDLEERAAAILRDTSRIRAEKEGLESHVARIRDEHERHQQDLVQQRVQLDKDRAMLVADAQSLHDSTYELCTLRDALAEEKDMLASGLQQLQTLQRQTSLEQTAVTQQVAAVADAEGKLQQLQLQISEKQAELSDQNLKVGRARKHWHVLRAEVQAQLQQWTNSNQDLPDLAALWDVIVSDNDGVELRTVPAKCKQCAKSRGSTGATPAATDQNGKENAQTEAVKVLTHKLAAFSSIINRRRSFAKEHQAVDKTTMAQLAAWHGQLGLRETLAWGRQAHQPVFPTQQGTAGGHHGTHGSLMPFSTTQQDHSHTWKQIQQPDSRKRPQQQFGDPDGLHQDRQRNTALPNGFVPLQPVSTTEDSFSYHESKGSKPHCMMSQHTNQESACSQDTMTNDDLGDSPAFQAVACVDKDTHSAIGVQSR